MEYQENRLVNGLGTFLPFEPGHGGIYEEHGDPDQKSIPTKAGATLFAAVRDPGIQLLILTGDAGHGKTHLCRRLLEQVGGLSPGDAHQRLLEGGFGTADLAEVEGRSLRIIKDFSEIDEQAAPSILQDTLEDDSHILVVCANEGRLRSVLSAGGYPLALARRTLEASNSGGRCSIEPGIFILDLNHQSVTTDSEGGSLLEQFLRRWVDDGRSWRRCDDCLAAPACPIKFNREHLRGLESNRDDSASARAGLHTLLRVAEQAGTTITIRELLILLAFSITGGLQCTDVHSRHRRSTDDRGWQFAYLFSQLIFDPPLNRDQEAALPLLRALRRLDPGVNAIRAVDDRLAAEFEPGELEFPPPGAESRESTPRTRKQARDEASGHRDLFRYLRRMDYFEGPAASVDGTTSRAERLGFRFHPDFERMLDSPPPEVRQPIRMKLLRGLEAVQDVRRGTRRVDFAIVDPAFGNVSGAASVLSATIPSNSVDLQSKSVFWAAEGDAQTSVPRCIDWLDRQIVVSFGGERDVVELDLLQFEFVMRSADGLACRRFFQGSIRRILARLARLSRAADLDADYVSVVFGDRSRRLMIDQDGSIVCEDS